MMVLFERSSVVRMVEVLVTISGEIVVQEAVTASTRVVLCEITEVVALLRQVFLEQGSVTVADVNTVLVI